jgi:maltose O-acetyltransferase
VIGERVRISSTTVPVELAAVDGGRIEIGDRTFLNYGVSISAHQLVRIGQRCLLGAYVMILDNNWHDIIDRTRTPPSQPVVLEDNVWLGNRVIVLPGVTIGHDAVVGAGAVVVKDIPPRSVAVGNPARVVKSF